MFKNLFKKHKSKEEVEETKVEDGAESFMKIKYEIMDTGEIVEIDANDMDAFDKMMSTKSTIILFD